MTTRAPRWRGPRRPDGWVDRGEAVGTALATSSATAQQPLSVAPWGSQTARAALHPHSHSHEDASQAVRHFKYSFLSAGRTAPEAAAAASFGDSASARGPSSSLTAVAPGESASAGGPGLRVNRRPGIMDATRRFDDNLDMSPEAKTARAVAAAQRDRAAAGLGYGSRHEKHFAYLSKELPPKPTERFFEERPCVFPTVDLPPLQLRPAAQLDDLSYAEQEAYSATFRRRAASGLGQGSKKTPNYYAYLANTYWRKR